ncbi:MAG: tetratricopeptide repeat protein, partial [Pseudomonadales bacterium]
PETLVEEVLQDAPLIQAYSRAQKKRGQILLLIACAIFAGACAIIYKLAFAGESTQANASNFDPVTQQIEASTQSAVVLEEVDPGSIPERLSMPEFSSADDAPVNMVVVEPARSAPKELRRAYTALNQGNLDQAESLYFKLSTTEVNKVPALSGLASVAIAKNQTDNARNHLQHILSIDRHNAWAVASLAALPEKESGIAASNGSSLSQLKSLQSADPSNHQIAYLLGNKFAAAGIWTEAQSAYFDAFALDSQNANYAFNLAIALDHLGKAKEASNFYLQALQLAETQGADFDIASLRKRLQRGDR